MLTKHDFRKIDGHYVTAVSGFHLSVEPSGLKGFRLVIYGALAEVPASRKDNLVPTDREWEPLLRAANAAASFLRVADDKQQG